MPEGEYEPESGARFSPVRLLDAMRCQPPRILAILGLHMFGLVIPHEVQKPYVHGRVAGFVAGGNLCNPAGHLPMLCAVGGQAGKLDRLHQLFFGGEVLVGERRQRVQKRVGNFPRPSQHRCRMKFVEYFHHGSVLIIQGCYAD
jgi:hypothetical protein